MTKLKKKKKKSETLEDKKVNCANKVKTEDEKIVLEKDIIKIKKYNEEKNKSLQEDIAKLKEKLSKAAIKAKESPRSSDSDRAG